MPQVRDTATISGGDIQTRAQKLWVAMQQDAVKRKIPQIMTRYGAGYYLLGTVQGYATRLWGSDSPDLRTIRTFLKASGNIVVVEQHIRSTGQRESKIFVRASWNSAVAVPIATGSTSTRSDRLDEVARKLTPHEAGEDRPPAAVQISFSEAIAPPITPTPEKEVAMTTNPSTEYATGLDTYGPIPETIDIGNGQTRCGACGYVASSPGSMGSHKRKHYHERKRAFEAGRVAKVEPVTLTPAPTPEPLADQDTRVLIKVLDNVKEKLESVATLELQWQARLDVVNMLERDNRLLKEENVRLVEEIRGMLADKQTIVSADPELEKRLGDSEVLIELIRGVVLRYQEAKAGPVRTLTDLEDLLDT